MAGELEKFLQEAAERLAQKVNQGQQPKPNVPPGTSAPQSVRSAERARPNLEPEIVDADIIEPVIVPRSNRRELGPDPLSSLDTRPGLALEIGLTDERMIGHLHDVFDHDVMKLKQASAALGRSSSSETDKRIDLQQRQRVVSPLIEMLRKPSTLRAAFIASEIFARKF